jgi:acetylornithine/succinyldiaminopimelate/putrescine aminotransferase
MKRSQELAKFFLERFSPLVGRGPVLRVEAKGALFGIDLASRALAVEVGKACIAERVLVSAIKSGLRLTPALTMDLGTLEEGLRRVRAAIRKAAGD